MKKSIPSLLAALTWTALLGPAAAQEGKVPSASPDQKEPTVEKPQKKDEKPAVDYIRYREEEGQAKLETVVRSLTNSDGVTVDLVGVVHIGDEAYYKEINTLLAGYDAVLFELVGDPEALQQDQAGKAKESEKGAKKADKNNPLRAVQKMVGNLLQLTFQLDHIDYTKPNFIHADLDESQFADEMKKRGESFMSLLGKSMRLQREGKSGKMEEELEKLDMGELMSALMSGSGSDKLKIVLAKAFSDAETLMENMEAEDGGTAIISGRNEAAFKKMDEAVKGGKKKLAVFYGAGHLPSMEETLVKKGYKFSKESWLAAWSMKTAKPAKSEKEKSTKEVPAEVKS
jgi:hypothetical protein